MHIWDRLDASRRMMERLRHLLSFVYNTVADAYLPIAVWTSVRGLAAVYAPRLVARPTREAEFRNLASEAKIQVDAAGNCQRDFVQVTQAMYERSAAAMRSNFTLARPAQPVLYLDATGASLGKGWTHVEVGSADYAGDCCQSRSTMGPLAGWTGSDKAIPIRENCSAVLPGFNRMVAAATLLVFGKELPCRPITSADMQGTKALYGMTSSSHSVWCRCRKG